MRSDATRHIGSDAIFERSVIDALAFLRDLGFSIAERGSTLVRFVLRNVEVDIYRGRKSYEIGAGIAIDGERFSLSELVRVHEPKIAESYRNPVATDDDGVVHAVTQVASMLRKYGGFALRGDAAAIATLTSQRREWAEAFALDVLAEQTRPLAEHAFRSGDFAKAAELYARIRSRLSSAESAKLALAEARSATRH